MTLSNVMGIAGDNWHQHLVVGTAASKRQMVQDLTPERVFWNPCDVKVDQRYRTAVLEPARRRIKVYSKRRVPVLNE